jgi:transposase
MKDSRRKYDLEFKKDVVKMSYESGKSVPELSKDLGISNVSVYAWRKELVDTGIVNNSKDVRDQGEQIKQLKKELSEVRMERDILKKAMVIFSSKK